MIGCTDIRIVHDDGKPIGVIMDWSDGTKTKAICEKSDRDNFNLDFGLTICMMKKLIDHLIGINHMKPGTAYMKLIDSCHDFLKEKEENEAAEKERLKAENEAKQRAKQDEARKKREAREREIEIQKEAYLRAMREYASSFPYWYITASSDYTLPDHG